MYIMVYVWYVSHARTAIDIVQRCVVYFDWPHENICATPLPRSFVSARVIEFMVHASLVPRP